MDMEAAGGGMKVILIRIFALGTLMMYKASLRILNIILSVMLVAFCGSVSLVWGCCIMIRKLVITYIDARGEKLFILGRLRVLPGTFVRVHGVLFNMRETFVSFAQCYAELNYICFFSFCKTALSDAG